MFAIRWVRVMRMPLPLNLNVYISNGNIIIYVMNVSSASVLCVNGPNVWLLIMNVSSVKLNGIWEQTVFAVQL